MRLASIIAVVILVGIVVGEVSAQEEEISPGQAQKISNLIVVLNKTQEVENRMTAAILKVNRWYHKRPFRALQLARVIYRAADRHKQSPWIALAMAQRESSLAPRVGDLRKRGSRGEEGYFQIMPKSVPAATCSKGRHMGDAFANADTAMCWLAQVQKICQSTDPWVYVSAYGTDRCPSQIEGRTMRSAIKARSLLCQMVGDEKCQQIWPS